MPTPDVLPSGVRRRLGARDAWLAAVLTGELLAGTLLGAAWEARSELGTLVFPAPVLTAQGDDVGEPRTATTWVVVPPPPSPPAPPPPPRRTVPRSPFEVQGG